MVCSTSASVSSSSNRISALLSIFLATISRHTQPTVISSRCNRCFSRYTSTNVTTFPRLPYFSVSIIDCFFGDRSIDYHFKFFISTAVKRSSRHHDPSCHIPHKRNNSYLLSKQSKCIRHRRNSY